MRRASRPPPEELEAEVQDLAEDGRGVARVHGKVTFIAGALPGERVRYRVRRRNRSADHGVATAVEVAAPGRVAPRCPHFDVCGGCSLQHLAAPAQVAFKQKQVLDALERIGGVQPEAIAPPVTGTAWGYRRRARLAVKLVLKKGGVVVGFREKDSRLVADLRSCDTLDPRVGTRLTELARCISLLGIRAHVPQVEVAAADTVALVFRVLRAPSAEDQQALAEFGRTHGFDIYLQPGGLDSVRPLLPDPPELAYSPDGSALSVAFRPTDFIQVHAEVNRGLVRQALEWLAPAPGEAVLELFCGLGNFSLPLARAGARVTAVEGEAGLVVRARGNAARNGLEVRFEHADLFQPDPAAAWLDAPYRAVLLDPPRAGAQEILPLVTRRRPERLVYVSCHPGTLARDAGWLVRERGYRLARIGVADMFPHTAHVESMALFAA